MVLLSKWGLHLSPTNYSSVGIVIFTKSFTRLNNWCVLAVIWPYIRASAWNSTNVGVGLLVESFPFVIQLHSNVIKAADFLTRLDGFISMLWLALSFPLLFMAFVWQARHKLVKFAVAKRCVIYCSVTSESLVLLLYCSEKCYWSRIFSRWREELEAPENGSWYRGSW